MGAAREEFLSRFLSFSAVLSEPYLIDKEPSNYSHNEKARLLRNGLGVMGFNILEDFIRRRVGEATSFLAGTNIDFDDFSEPMKMSLTHDAINATLQVAKTNFNDKFSKIEFVREQAKLIGSSLDDVRGFSEFAFGWDASNVNHEHVSKVLKTFGVEKPWEHIGKFSRRVGVGIPDAQGEFVNAFHRRHEAAHDAKANISPTDLQSFSRSAIGIAVGVDALISECLQKFLIVDKDFVYGTNKIKSEMINVRFLNKKGGDIREYREGAHRASKRYRSFEVATVEAGKRASKNHEMIIVTDKKGSVEGWRTQEE